MTAAQLIQALQDLVAKDKDFAHREVRWDDGDGYIVDNVYADSDDEGDPVVVIY